MRVVVTREHGRNDDLRGWLPDEAHVFEVPATTTKPLKVSEVARQLAAQREPVAWIVVTSARASEAALEVVRRWPGARVAAVGERTASSLSDRGVRVHLVGTGGVNSLAAAIDGGGVVSVGARDTRPELALALGARGIGCAHVAAYETRARELSVEEVELLARADVVSVGAPSAWAVVGPHVSREALLLVPGATTRAAIPPDREVLEGWDSALATRVREWFATRAERAQRGQ